MNDKDLDILIQERLSNINEMGFEGLRAIGAKVGSTLPSVSTAIFTISSLTALASMVYRAFLSKKDRECGNYEGSARTICNIKFDIRGLQLKLSKLNESKGKCSKTSDLQKCNETFNTEITETRNKIKELNDSLRELKQYGITQQ